MNHQENDIKALKSKTFQVIISILTFKGVNNRFNAAMNWKNHAAFISFRLIDIFCVKTKKKKILKYSNVIFTRSSLFSNFMTAIAEFYERIRLWNGGIWWENEKYLCKIKMFRK